MTSFPTCRADITEDDCDLGVRTATACPLALALQRVLPPTAHAIHVRQGVIEALGHCWLMDRNLFYRVLDYDAGLMFRPATVELGADGRARIVRRE